MEVSLQTHHSYSENFSFQQDNGSIKVEYQKQESFSGVFQSKGYSIEEFKEKFRKDLVDMLMASQESNNKSPDFLYQVQEGTDVAEVPEYWNAENTSQRIVDFAMSFSSLSQLDNEEYVEKMRGAIEAGFEDAKNILGELPGPKAKLFNDTYEKVMTKLDELLDSSLQREVQENTSDEIVPQLRNTFDLVA
jgi:hypothetical protein